MAITTGDILRLVISQVWNDGNIMNNVFAAQIVGGGGPWDAGDVLDDLEDYADTMYTNISALVADPVDSNEVFGYVWDAINGDWDLFGSEPWAQVFNDPGNELPRGVAGFLKAPTTDPDVQGRKYIGGPTELSLTIGLWNAPYLAALVLFGGDWIAPYIGALTGATITPGVWSVKNQTFHEFENEVSVVTIPAYQRRRKRGVGI